MNMLDVTALDSDALTSLMVSVAVLGILLLAGVALRMFVPLFRRFFIPAALIGGIIGLALGPNAIGLVSEDLTGTWAAIPGLLIAVVFAPMLMGQKLPSLKQSAKTAAPHILYSYFSSFAVIAVPALLTYFIFHPVFGVNPMFSTIFEVSWPGGHGTAAGMAPAYEALGWDNGSSLALGSATFGLLFGIIGGMVMINIAARKGQLSAGRNAGVLDRDTSDVLSVGKAEVQGLGRLNKSSLDNLAFHVSLIGVSILIGLVFKYFIDMLITGVPLFPLAMIGGLVVQVILNRTPLAPLVDKKTLDSIAGISLDFLVVAAVASISIPVILDNWIPLTVTTVVVAVMSLGVFYIIGPRIFKEDWFEHGIINFGSMTGVVSVGLVLVRAADPHAKTDAGRAFALRSPFASPFVGGGLITAMFPILAVQYGNLWLGVGSIVICLLLLLVAKLLGIWGPPQRGRVETSGEPAQVSVDSSRH
jgi:glutamate:Na+ symporter, ESS family